MKKNDPRTTKCWNCGKIPSLNYGHECVNCGYLPKRYRKKPPKNARKEPRNG